MKKMMKKITAILAMFAMVVTMLPAMGVKAATIDTNQKGKLTIEKKEKGNTTEGVKGAVFSIYKIAELSTGTDGKYKSWNLLKAYSSLGLTPDSLGSINTSKLEEKAEDAKKIALEQGTKLTATTGEDGKAIATNLELGYYLVVETTTPEGYVACKPFFVAIPSTNNYNGTGAGDAWIYDITVNPKNEKMPEVNKTADDTFVGLENPVNYTLDNMNFPNYDGGYENIPVQYIITDQLSEGLDLVENTVVVKVGDTDVDPTQGETKTYTKSYEGRKLTITFDSDYIKAHKGAAIEVTYTAKLNENAVVKDSINNTVEVKYTHNPDGKLTTTTITEKVYTAGIKVTKTGENGTGLDGVEFEIYTDEACTEKFRDETFTTNEKGILTIDRLAEGTYYLKETKTKAGYTLLTSPIKIDVNQGAGAANGVTNNTYNVNNGADTAIPENGYIPVSVVNQKGFTLPETGGMGTYLFTIGGIVVMMGAALALLGMKKGYK